MEDGERTPRLEPMKLPEQHAGTEVEVDGLEAEQTRKVQEKEQKPMSRIQKLKEQLHLEETSRKEKEEEHVEEEKQHHESVHESQPQHRTHVDSTPLPTDSMITVPLSDSHKSVPFSEARASTTHLEDKRKSRRSMRLSDDLHFDDSGSSGSDYDDDDSFEEAIVVQATVATATKAGSIRTYDDGSSIAETKRDDSSSIVESAPSEYSEEERDEEIEAPKLQLERKDTAWPQITINEDFTPIDDSRLSERLSLAKTVTIDSTSAEEPAVEKLSSEDPLSKSPSEEETKFGEPSSMELPSVEIASVESPSKRPKRVSIARPEISVDTDVHRSSVSSVDLMGQAEPARRMMRGSMDFQSRNLDRISTMDMEETLEMIEEAEESDRRLHRSRTASADSDSGSPVDWDKLDRTEEHLETQTAADEDGDEVRSNGSIHESRLTKDYSKPPFSSRVSSKRTKP